MDMFNGGFQRLASSMIAHEKMQGAITSNISNADTPNYKADQRSFANFLTEQNSLNNSSKAATTNSKHIANTSPTRLAGNIFQQDQSRKMDGNSVDIQTEMARMSENQLMHELSIQLVKGRLNGLMNAVKEGNR